MSGKANIFLLFSRDYRVNREYREIREIRDFPNFLKLSKFLKITKIKKARSEIRAVEYREVSSLKIIFYILLDKITNTEWGIGIMNFILQAICDRSR